MTDLFNEYFGYGLSSIVFQEIRESKALAYSTYAYYSNPQKAKEAHYLSAYVGTQPDKISEKLNDERFDAELKGKVLEMIFADNEMPLNILIELLTVKDLEKEIEDKLVEHVKKVRQQVSHIAEEAMKLQTELRSLKETLDERMHTIENYHQQISRYGEKYPANPKVLQDLKLDIEMAYSSLKESKE